MTKTHKLLLNRFPVGVPVFRSKMEEQHAKDPGFNRSLIWLLKNRLIDVVEGSEPQQLRRRTNQEIAEMVTNEAASKGKV